MNLCSCSWRLVFTHAVPSLTTYWSGGLGYCLGSRSKCLPIYLSTFFKDCINCKNRNHYLDLALFYRHQILLQYLDLRARICVRKVLFISERYFSLFAHMVCNKSRVTVSRKLATTNIYQHLVSQNPALVKPYPFTGGLFR